MKANEIIIQSNNVYKATKSPQSEDQKKLMDACRQFEAVFVNMMLKQMRSTISSGGLGEKSQARDIFESMQDEAMAEEMTKGQGTGLAQELYKQLSREMNRGRITQSQE